MELISVHVPKTAGVTFRTFLQKVYGKTAVALDYGDRALDPLSTFQTDPASWRAEADRYAASFPLQVRVVHGHFGGAKYDYHFPEARKIVWLREPVARLVSHYYYWRTLPPTSHSLHRRLLAENLTLLEFARLESMRNIFSRVFLCDCRLQDFAFVGIQERFASDLRRLSTRLGWSADLPLSQENRNDQADYQPDNLGSSDRAEIAALNAADIALYEQALRLQAD